MRKALVKYLFFFAVIQFLFSCAQISSPVGGPKDIEAPQLDSLRTLPRNGSVNFSGSEIRLEFDEYIRVNNPRQQVLISPKPERSPEYIQKGKSLVIRFKDELKENTTYTLSFGTSVADITEGNVARGLSYVFSTGPVLDSFSVSGSVQDAYTLQQCSGWMVLLYSSVDDSAVFKNDPDYLGVTLEDGTFQVNHLREGSYRVFALKDQNNNLRYDPGTDEIAFLSDSLVLNSSDPAKTNVLLRAFKEPASKAYLKKSLLIPPGRVVLSYSSDQEFESVYVQSPESNDSLFSSNNWFFRSMVNDTLELWIPPVGGSASSIIVQRKGIRDTVVLYGDKRQVERAMDVKLNFSSSPSASHHPNELLRFRFSDPLLDVDQGKVKILMDSVEIKVGIQNDFREIKLLADYDKYAGKKGQVLFLPNAIQDVFGRTNDTLRFSFKVLTVEQMGVLLLKTEISNEQSYFFELVNSRGQVVDSKNSSSGFEWVLKDLLPGDYSLRAIVDNNLNGKWDSGNLLQRKQPEAMVYFGKSITIRANWDIEMTWKLQ